MQVETAGVSWDDAEGQDVEPTPGRWVIVETGYRLLEPEYGNHPKEEEVRGPLGIKVSDDENIPLSGGDASLSDDEWEASAKRLGIGGGNGEGDTLGLPEPVGALAGAEAAAEQLL